MLSHDLATYLGVFGSWQDFEDSDPDTVGPDYTIVHTQVLPALHEAGLDPAETLAMLERNPRTLFEAPHA